MPTKYVDAKSGRELTKEEFDVAMRDGKAFVDEMARKELERREHRTRLILQVGEKLGLSAEEALLLFG